MMDPFEREVREGLKRLAEEAPPGPLAGDLQRRLRVRTARRRLLFGAAAAGLVVAALVGWPRSEIPRIRDVARARTIPIPSEADRGIFASRIVEYLSAIGARAAHLEKGVQTGAIISLRGPLSRPLDEVRDDLDLLLQNFDEVRFSLRDGELHFTVTQIERCG